MHMGSVDILDGHGSLDLNKLLRKARLFSQKKAMLCTQEATGHPAILEEGLRPRADAAPWVDLQGPLSPILSDRQFIALPPGFTVLYAGLEGYVIGGIGSWELRPVRARNPAGS